MPQALSQAWRLIESPALDIASHMALDRELFEAFVNDPQAPPALRIYKVNEPGISVGHSYKKRGQVTGSFEVSDLSPFFPLPPWGGVGRVRGEDVCVRPTGGGLVHHGKDLIYSVIARRNTFPTFHQVRTSYLSFHEAVCEAFQKLGVEARLLRCDEAKRHTGLGECFRDPVATDVLIHDKKVAGGAQWRRGGNFLHQGSVQLVGGITFGALKPALIDAFERKFQTHWVPG